MTVRFYSSVAVQTTLTAGITSGATSINVASTAGFPSSFPYTLALDYGIASEELVDVTAAAGLTLTVTRGVDGTSTQAHGSGATVKHVATGRDFADMRTHEEATVVHGATGAVVGTTNTQTLTNKTLTTPTINGGTLSGTLAGAHTLSGAVTLSGGGTLTGTFTSSGATLAGSFAGTPTFSGAVTLSGGGALSGTFTGAQVTAIRAILSEVGGVIKWGGDYNSRKDEMHFEIDGTEAAVKAAAAKL